MRHVPALVRRELAAYFLGPMAYLVLLAFQLLACVNFVDLVESLSRPQSLYSAGNDPINLYIPASLGFWISVLVAVPLLTMRLLAEERRSGTLETLLTVPVTEVEVVLAKWLAGFVMYTLLLAPFFLYLPFLRHFGNVPFDWGPIASLLIGLSTLGLMFVAIGLFFSALSRNQIVAAMATFATLFVILVLFVIEYGGAMRRQTSWAEALRYLTVVSQVHEFGLGQLDPRYLALHLSVAVFLVWMTVLVMRSRRGA